MYIDTNVLAYSNNDAGEKGEKARAILKRAIGDRAVVSVLAIDELMWVLRRNKVADRTRRIVERLYAAANIDVVEVHATAPLRALEFMEKHNLKPRDAMHLAIMEHNGETTIASDDPDFDGIPGVKRISLAP